MSTAMQTFLIVGDKTQQEAYILSFKKEKNITPYLVTQFDEVFKITDARACQKLLSVKIANSESRLILISNPTLDSQHALLKTLEELPERTYVLFLVPSKEVVIPTVLSRASIIDLAVENTTTDKEIMFPKDAVDGTHKILSYISSTVTNEEMETYIMSLRKAVIQKVILGEDIRVMVNVLKTISYNFALTKTNNINKKMALECAVLAS